MAESRAKPTFVVGLVFLGVWLLSFSSTHADESQGDSERARPATTEADIAARMMPLAEGFTAPYFSYLNLGRGFDAADCTHQGLDVGGVGENAGLGTPITAIAQSEIKFIGTPERNSKKFGERDIEVGFEERGGLLLPRQLEVPGYGLVYPFTSLDGSAETGVLIKTEVVGGPLDGHSVRYMHLAAVEPHLQVGDIVQAGQELGLMGATGYEDNLPHLHLDIEDRDDLRVDPAPYLGLQKFRPSSCAPINKRALRRARLQAEDEDGS